MALVATVLVGLVLWLPRILGGDEHQLATPGQSGPSIELFREDFPGARIDEGLGHDGQQFYAVARSADDPLASAGQLDYPRYRLQRIAFPVVAGLLAPSGGGTGLVRTLVAVNLLGVLLLGAVVGMLSTSFGGPAWVAGVGALLPGSVIGIRLGTPEALATGLVLGAVLLSLHGRKRAAVVLAVAAVLTREVHLLVLLGFALWRRDREGAALVLAPALAAGAWGLYLRGALPRGEGDVGAFTRPGRVLLEALSVEPSQLAQTWAVFALLAFLLVLCAVGRGLKGPLQWVLIGQFLLLPFLAVDVVGLGANLSRVVLPSMAVLVALAAAPRPGGAPLTAGRAGRTRPGDPVPSIPSP